MQRFSSGLNPGWLLSGLLLCAPGAFALEGVGYGVDADTAQRHAAADLAAMVQVRINSVVELCTQVRNNAPEDCGTRVVSRSATDLPLLGLRYFELPGGSEPAGARASLQLEISKDLYRDKLATLEREFAEVAKLLATTQERRARHSLLERQIATLRALADHRLVAVALGMKVNDPPASEAALMLEREALEVSVDSIAFAARLLLRDIKGRLPEAAPLNAVGSREATPLGSALADALRAEMSGRQGPRLQVTGEYRLLTQGDKPGDKQGVTTGDIDIVLEIRQAIGKELVAVRSVRLTRAGYAGYRAEPLAPDFERLLRQGEAVSGDLRVELVTTEGGRTLKFTAGETIKLVARTNRAAYFYIVGHVMHEGAQLSYLLPLQEVAASEPAEARFIRRVPADLANHYGQIGEFTVEAPFGTEHLQIVASTAPLKNALPGHRYDPKSGYYILNGSQGNANKGLQTTRGLKPKPENKAMVAEGTLTFTTVER